MAKASRNEPPKPKPAPHTVTLHLTDDEAIVLLAVLGKAPWQLHAKDMTANAVAAALRFDEKGDTPNYRVYSALRAVLLGPTK